MLYSKNKNYGVETVIPNIVGLRQPASDKDYMYFQAVEDGASVILKSPSSFNVSLEISQDGVNWNNWSKSVVGVYDVFDKITLSKRGDYVFIRAINLNVWTSNTTFYMYFMLGYQKIACGGNIMSMISKDVILNSITYDYCFYKLFNSCTSLVSTPWLPATTLKSYCYSNMFRGCTSLITAPELPATTLAEGCYSAMFNGCTNLTTAPELPATTLENYCYDGMFYGCVKLKNVTEFTVNSIGAYSCRSMFNGCSDLMVAPSILLTNSLSSWCCESMYSNCKSLEVPPELPATTLQDTCCQNMFNGCTSLTTAPELPATTLADYCYQYMFQGCTSLTMAPELPATTLARYCYSSMFYGCTSLTSGSDMQKARTLNSSCCNQMYYGCKNLTNACTPNISSWTPSYFSNWLYNVASAGTLYKPSNLTNIEQQSANGIPVGWNTDEFSQTVTLSASGSNTYGFSYSIDGVSYTLANDQTRQVALTHPQGITITTENQTDYIEIDGVFKQFGTTVELTYEDLSNGSVISCGHISDINLLSFTAQEAGSTIGMQHNGTNTGSTKPVIYISTDNKNTFTLWDYSTITLSNVGDTVYFYGTNPNGIGRNSDNFSQFTMSEKISANGDCTTLIYSNGSTSIPFYGMYKLFYNCTSLTTAPELPATTLASCCYQQMFQGCTSLTTAPELPATALTSQCYQSMFQGCTSLTTAPELPATTLAVQCYYQMFLGCTSLTTAPELPATTLASNCYAYMFQGCTSLTTAPELPATTLASSCYSYMFYGCTKLNYIKVCATSWNVNDASNWVYNVASSGVFVKPQGTETPYGTNGIPEGWYVTDSETKTITLSAVESDCYGFSYKVNNGSVQTLSDGQTSEITIVPQDTLEIMTNDVNNFRCVFLGDNVVGFGSGCTIGMTDMYYGNTITCKDPTFDKCLEFKAVSSSTTIGMQHNGTNTGVTKPTIYVSEGSKTNWRLWDYSDITLTNVDDVVYMFGYNRGGLSNSSSNYSKFSTNKNVLLSGSVNSLINVIGNDDFLKSYAFYYLFLSTQIITAPELPATTLASYCYQQMFQGCTSLTTAPKLPATTLASGCYYGMFANCKSLTTAPELPATTLSDNCYISMFQGCTSLTTAPVLPATTQVTQCYSYMFQGCTSLVTAPELPATTLASYCYQQMFQGCTSLTTAPKLPATTLASSCYRYMFQNCTKLTKGVDLRHVTNLGTGSTSCGYMYYGCTNLNTAYAPNISGWPTSHFDNWLGNVASSGTMYKKASLSIPVGSNGVPSGWFLNEYDSCLYFESKQANSTVVMTHNGTNTGDTKPVIYISSDKENWTQWDFSTITLSNVGDRVYMYGNNPNGVSVGNSNYSTFTMSGKIAAGGDCTTLLDVAGTTSIPNYGFVRLFESCQSLTSAPELPVTTVGAYSCYYMFHSCTNLTTAPELPATNLSSNCYNLMFYQCTNLTTAPSILPATTLANHCYDMMFDSCRKLTSTPILPATTLANYCYQRMFYSCQSLTTAPELPSTTLADSCYYNMFVGCTSLTAAPELPATTLANYCYQSMFGGCTGLTVAPDLPAQTLKNGCYANMFHDCTSLTTAPELPATTLAGDCYIGMFANCTSLTTAPELPSTTLGWSCYEKMFYGCTNLQTAPELPATELKGYCYEKMFYGCTSLTSGADLRHVTNLGTTSPCVQMYDGCTNLNTAYAPTVSSWTNSYFTSWLNNVASSGTMYKSAKLSIPTGVDGIPSGWTMNEYDGFLFFEAKQANSTVGMRHIGTNTGNTKPVIYISSNKSAWTQWDYTTITLANVGDRVYMYGNNPNGIGVDLSNFSKFTMSGRIVAGGDCTTLLDVDGTTSIPNYGLASLFDGCASLTTAPELPATTLAGYCYYCMFYGCTSLTTAPELPATTLANDCYSNMFNGCTNLTTAPELPATTLAQACYVQMFYRCTSLTTAPELPSTTIALECYKDMFGGCTGLTVAPELPAPTLLTYCYARIFQGCTNLNYIKVGATSWNTSYTRNWVDGVSPTGDFNCPQSLQIGTGVNEIPSGWTRHDV